MKQKKLKTLIPFVLLAAISGGSLSISSTNGEARTETTNKQPEIRNIIFMVGDGMGPSTTTALRYWRDNHHTRTMEKTTFDRYFIGKQMTYSNDSKENITDSAAAATAMATGYKTYNAAISVDRNKKEVKTVLEAAKSAGKSTGLVSTSELSHATPGSYGAHDPDRKHMDSIANDFYDEKINGHHKIDVMLGGGRSNFIRKDRHLVTQFKKDGYSYITTKQQLTANRSNQLLGIFSKEGLPKMIDREKSVPSLKDMTTAAVERLATNKKGFFLMVEGSQIDWAEHDNDVVSTMSETRDFERAFAAAIDFAKKDKHTLVIATADHATGGFTVGANGNYNWFAQPLKAFKRTPAFISQKINEENNVKKVLKTYIDLSLTHTEIQSVEQAATTKDVKKISKSIKKIADARSVTGWTTSGHTGEDVNVYGYGPGVQKFSGLLDNTDQAKHIFEAIHKGRLR
ncbi:alkaline phosphatase [Fictibacillus macauensis ZFHKF-1]|uniref:Alkaline phosphatase n=1 Tax=Fictibacillus macauensis ZFHKF-1 TaxID=1196324 RepID=I8UFL8_9BACL|nr:alkaline phosphatase [Fictibacillus macauensis]EIT85690.1 alkaline phosphatase [Fictibacillus macauensis ZFHKF-1]